MSDIEPTALIGPEFALQRPGRAGRNMSGTSAERRKAMRIPWLPSETLSEAIPPDYTEWIGGHLLNHLEADLAVAS